MSIESIQLKEIDNLDVLLGTLGTFSDMNVETNKQKQNKMKTKKNRNLQNFEGAKINKNYLI